MENMIMQGEQYGKEFTVSVNNELVPAEMISDIEFFVAGCRKTMGNGGITFNEEANSWIVWLTQEETFAMHEGKQKLQARVKFVTGEILGYDFPDVVIIRNRSKEVL